MLGNISSNKAFSLASIVVVELVTLFFVVDVFLVWANDVAIENTRRKIIVLIFIPWSFLYYWQ